VQFSVEICAKVKAHQSAHLPTDFSRFIDKWPEVFVDHLVIGVFNLLQQVSRCLMVVAAGVVVVVAAATCAMLLLLLLLLRVVVVAAAARRCLMGLICCAHTSGGRRWRVFQKNKKTTFWVWPELKINSVPNNIVADLCFGPTLHSTTVHTIPYTQ